jgi:hypothetical protein
MERPCGHADNTLRGLDYEPGMCRVCWLFLNDPEYEGMERERTQSNGRQMSPLPQGKERPCGGCKGKKKSPLVDHVDVRKGGQELIIQMDDREVRIDLSNYPLSVGVKVSQASEIVVPLPKGERWPAITT